MGCTFVISTVKLLLGLFDPEESVSFALASPSPVTLLSFEVLSSSF